MSTPPEAVLLPGKRSWFWLIPSAAAAATGLLIFWPAWRAGEWSVLALAPLCLAFWFYGYLSAAGALASALLARRFRALTASLPEPPALPPVAILYACCNDFRPECVETMVHQDHRDAHLFVLDDSDAPEHRTAAEEWCARHEDVVTYLHRPARRGYKAGNLNDGLAAVPARFEVLLICDADERLGPGTARELARWLAAVPRLGWVQALHSAAPGASEFATALAHLVGCGWYLFMPWRVWFGLPPILGHGVLIRRSALKSVGGFPEVSSEDIVLTGKLRQRGWLGACAWTTDGAQEDIPPTIHRFQRRIFRWTSQDTGTLGDASGPMLRTMAVSRAERIDWVVRNGRFPVAGLALPFLLLLAAASLMRPEAHAFPLSASATVVGCVAGLSPVVVFFLHCRRRWWRVPAICASGVTVSLFCLPTVCVALLSRIAGRRPEFAPTGSAVGHSRSARGTVAAPMCSGASLLAAGCATGEPLLGIIGALLLGGPALIGSVPFATLRWIVFSLLLLGGSLCAIGIGSLWIGLAAGAAFAVMLSQ